MKVRTEIRTAIAIFCAVAFYPRLAFCAEPAKGGDGSWFALLFYVINFAIFVWLLVHYIGPMARGFFHQRAGTIRETLTTADIAFKEARELTNQAAERLTKLDAEKAKLRADLDAETAYQVGRIGEIGREAAERLRRDAVMTSAALVEAAGQRIRERLAGEAGRLARDLIARRLESGDQERLLRGFTERLRQEARD
jgi:F0F1-type ATP synthase membrane subunit b/b'